MIISELRPRAGTSGCASRVGTVTWMGHDLPKPHTPQAFAEGWLCRQNIRNFSAQLSRQLGEPERTTISRLLTEEEEKLRRILSPQPPQAP